FKGSLTYFNSLYSVTINEEHLNRQKLCSGKCNLIDKSKRIFTNSLNYPNECHGLIQSCWLHQKNEKRQSAWDDYSLILYYIRNYQSIKVLRKRINNALYKYHHTGNICKCLCERTYNPKLTPRGQLLDSVCFDPVSVDTGKVATGARFRVRKNRIHLELQQGILTNGTIDPQTVTWKEATGCKYSKKVVYDFRNGAYKSLKITLEDIVLPNNVAVTGVTFGKSVHGQRIDDDGNIDSNWTITKSSMCGGKTKDLVHVSKVLVASTSLVGKNLVLSKSCRHHVLFGGTSEKYDNIQHIVPYIDLQEVTTDPPEPFNGIGWYYRGLPGYGGFLALQVFKYR
ncbi:GSCOCG00002502001-RA-CDS, partial [Cotesia congregata]